MFINRHAVLAFFFASSSVASGCTNFFGDTIQSVLELPTFPSTVEEIEAARDLYFQEIGMSLSDLLAIDPETVATFEESPIGKLERLKFQSTRIFGEVNFLADTSDEEEIRNAATDATAPIINWWNENIVLNQALYRLLVEFAATDFAQALTGERRRILDVTIEGYDKSGFSLNEVEQDMLALWQAQMSELQREINQNIITDEGTIEFTEEDLDGLTELQFGVLPFNNETSKYLVSTRNGRQFSTVSSNANNEETRRAVNKARFLRNYDRNADLIHELVSLRQSSSTLLGYENWADLANSDRLIGSGQAAYEFLENLSSASDEAFLKEQERLSAGKVALGGDSTVHFHDVSYLQTAVTEQEHQLDPAEVSEYFQEDNTLRGVFDIFERLFDITIAVVDVPKEDSWADDNIRMAILSEEVDDGSSSYTNALGAVYLDLHPREGKSGGAYLRPVFAGHVREDGTYQAPVGAIVANFPGPTADRPSLWSLGNTNTFLHEFGHAIHHVFACSEFASFSSLSIPRDFVETPSQMLERWLGDRDVVMGLSKHYETGEEMPQDLLDKVFAASNAFPAHSIKFSSGLSFGDLYVHSYTSADTIPSDGYGIYRDADEELGNTYYPQYPEASLFASFTHIFASAYDAGYYGYLHADVIAADFASQFRNAENGFFDKDVAARYRKEVLSVGSSRDELESIRSFLGRDFNVDAYIAEMLESLNTAEEDNSGSTSSLPATNTSAPVESEDEDNVDPLSMSNDSDAVLVNADDDEGNSSNRSWVVTLVSALIGAVLGGTIGYCWSKNQKVDKDAKEDEGDDHINKSDTDDEVDVEAPAAASS